MPPKIGKSAIEVTLNVQELYDLFIHDASDKFDSKDLVLLELQHSNELI
jgi:hypothetical protein